MRGKRKTTTTSMQNADRRSFTGFTLRKRNKSPMTQTIGVPCLSMPRRMPRALQMLKAVLPLSYERTECVRVECHVEDCMV